MAVAETRMPVLKLTFDPHVAPAGVVLGHAHDQGCELRVQRRASHGPGLVSPLALHQLAVPAQKRARSDDESRPTLAGQYPRQRRQEHPVAAAQLGAADLSLENCEFMAKDEQLEFELPLSIPTGRGDSEQEPQQEIDKGEEHGAMLQRRCSEGESQ